MAMRRSLLILLLLALPRVSHASDLPAAAAQPIFRIVLSEGDTLRAIAVKPEPFDMLAITMSDSTIRHMASVNVRAILDADGNDRTAWVVERRKVLDPPRAHQAEEESSHRSQKDPRAAKRTIFISETSFLLRVTPSTEGGDDRNHALSFDVGLMRNIAEGSGVGLTAFFASGTAGVSHNFFDGGFRARYRRWVSPTAYAEVAPGIVLGEDRAGDAITPGYSLQATFSPSPYLGFTAEVFTIHRNEHRFQLSTNQDIFVHLHETDLLLGARIGRLPGLLGGIPAALLGLINAVGAAETDETIIVP